MNRDERMVMGLAAIRKARRAKTQAERAPEPRRVCGPDSLCRNHETGAEADEWCSGAEHREIE